MTIPFPVIPRGTTISPHLVRVGGDLVSTLGGPTQRITRIGSRYSADVQLPTLDAPCAAKWLACPLLADAAGDTLSLVMPQMVDASHLGAVLGTGAAGAYQVTFSGTAPKVGMWFSFSDGGRHYLHQIVGVDPALHTAKIAPPLRKAMSTSPMEFAHPVLEGFVDGTTWSLDYFRFVGHKFTITESA